MESLGMGQKELAIRTRLTVQSLHRIFKGEQTITYETANRLELATGVQGHLSGNWGIFPGSRFGFVLVFAQDCFAKPLQVSVFEACGNGCVESLIDSTLGEGDEIDRWLAANPNPHQNA
jgi:transcriptional regulator with XRE-family HTH domain